ncbi:hypothetical protein QYE76_003308 [Lolium multiflorum]|uniref:Transposase (putative) gypsy type domain-containing protein n=1 Tax=Lolium multiflorum TaxID=4521 RepID=A0AAD8RNG1_LOLMU|nr:hypothetical protein QYE76_003308 [Lolium multiflorum]
MATEDLGNMEWERSKISPQDINLLKKLGISKKEGALRFPSEESYPIPPMEYRVSFVDHLIRGLSAPIHNFLRGLLFMYGLHRTPNSILHISIFITLCEAFLGVQPNWALWKRIFFCRRNGSANVSYNIGGVVICVRPDVEYFDVKFPDSLQGWRKKWLYIHEENHGSVEDNILLLMGKRVKNMNLKILTMIPFLTRCLSLRFMETKHEGLARPGGTVAALPLLLPEERGTRLFLLSLNASILKKILGSNFAKKLIFDNYTSTRPGNAVPSSSYLKKAPVDDEFKIPRMPKTLPDLMEKFRDAPRIHGFVRPQLSAGARFAMMMIKICYPKFDMSQIVTKCLAKMAKRKRDVGKIDDLVTPVAEDMMDELLRMDAEFFVKGSYAEHSTRTVNTERMTIDNILGSH